MKSFPVAVAALATVIVVGSWVDAFAVSSTAQPNLPGAPTGKRRSGVSGHRRLGAAD